MTGGMLGIEYLGDDAMQAILFWLALLGAATPPVTDPSALPHKALIDEIEQAVVLPPHSSPLPTYGRNYALNDAGLVVATYLIPFQPLKPDFECSTMSERDMATRPCSNATRQKLLAESVGVASGQTPANTRRWFTSTRDLPHIFDGQCNQVNVEYDPEAHRVVRAYCNGVA